MNYLLIFLIAVSLSVQAAVRKSYGQSVQDKGTYLFNGISCLVAAIFFFVSGGFKFEFNMGVTVMSLIFGVFFGISTYTSFTALQVGPMSLTSLVLSYSLLLATVYGICFKNEKVSIAMIIGLVFLVVSMVCINLKKDDKKASVKWLILAVAALFSNGICTIIQREEQIIYEGKYLNEFMITALVGIFIAFIIVAFVTERNDIKLCMKKGTLYMIIWGVANGMANLFVMILATKMAASLMFPLISGSSIILTWVMARFFYKEKLTTLQNIGLVLGTVAVILLNM